MINILIYGDEQDQKKLLTMLDRAEPMEGYNKRYTYVSDRSRFLKEMQNFDVDLAIFARDGEDGRDTLLASRLFAPKVPKIWISDNLDYALEGYRYECLWFFMKPIEEIDEIEFAKALEKFMTKDYLYWKTRANKNTPFPQGGFEYESE